MVDPLFEFGGGDCIDTRHKSLTYPVYEYEPILKKFQQRIHATLRSRLKKEMNLG